MGDVQWLRGGKAVRTVAAVGECLMGRFPHGQCVIFEGELGHGAGRQEGGWHDC